MKRPFSLVEYSSSDEELSANSTEVVKPPPKQRRTLPSLPAHLLPHTPVDNPALHQGRRRTVPHVEGQFAAYVYVPLLIPNRTKLCHLLSRILLRARGIVPSLHVIGLHPPDTPDSVAASSSASSDFVELHVSLTRPTYLRAHQREEFKRAVQLVARARHRFTASVVTLSELTNDERTRTFLTLEIGAGHDEFKSLSEGLGPALRSIRQKDFYEYPRFHASIAWALLDDGRSPAGSSSLPLDSSQDSHPSLAPPCPDVFPTITCFPASFIPELRAEFEKELVQGRVGIFEVDEVHCRIGKDVSKWRLAI